MLAQSGDSNSEYVPTLTQLSVVSDLQRAAELKQGFSKGSTNISKDDSKTYRVYSSHFLVACECTEGFVLSTVVSGTGPDKARW